MRRITNGDYILKIFVADMIISCCLSMLVMCKQARGFSVSARPTALFYLTISGNFRHAHSNTKINGNNRVDQPHRRFSTLRQSNGDDSETAYLQSLCGKNLVSIEECLEAQKECDTSKNSNGIRVLFIDGSWFHKGDRNGRLEYEQGTRIAGAKYFDMDDIATSFDLYPNLNPKNLPHMLPTKQLFAAAMDQLDIQNKDHIVVYGTEGSFFTPRIWFTFRALGHDPKRVHLMQGSLKAWEVEGGKVDSTPKSAIKASELDLTRPPRYVACDAQNVCNMEAVMNAVKEHQSSEESCMQNDNNRPPMILDPRGSSYAKGHMPGALHIPYSSLVDPKDCLRFKPQSELQRMFDEAGLKKNQPIICSCGSGVSVCSLFVSLLECGFAPGDISIYDGSWAEWKDEPQAQKVVSSSP